jgi:hypothetical protein
VDEALIVDLTDLESQLLKTQDLMVVGGKVRNHLFGDNGILFEGLLASIMDLTLQMHFNWQCIEENPQ